MQYRTYTRKVYTKYLCGGYNEKNLSSKIYKINMTQLYACVRLKIRIHSSTIKINMQPALQPARNFACGSAVDRQKEGFH